MRILIVLLAAAMLVCLIIAMLTRKVSVRRTFSGLVAMGIIVIVTMSFSQIGKVDHFNQIEHTLKTKAAISAVENNNRGVHVDNLLLSKKLVAYTRVDLKNSRIVWSCVAPLLTKANYGLDAAKARCLRLP